LNNPPAAGQCGNVIKTFRVSLGITPVELQQGNKKQQEKTKSLGKGFDHKVVVWFKEGEDSDNTVAIL